MLLIIGVVKSCNENTSEKSLDSEVFITSG